MEINNDTAHDLRLTERRFPMPALDAEPRPDVVVQEDAALLECLDGEPWG